MNRQDNTASVGKRALTVREMLGCVLMFIAIVLANLPAKQTESAASV